MAKLLLLQLLLTFVVTVFGIAENSFRYPANCVLPKCTYTANWTKGSDGINFFITAKQADRRWTGIGFSKEKNMKHMDVVYTPFLEQMINGHGLWENGKKVETLPPLFQEIRQTDGLQVFKFTHPFHSQSKKDFSFTDKDCYYLCFFVDNEKILDDKGSVSLNKSKAIFSDKQICVKDLKTEESPSGPGGGLRLTLEGDVKYPEDCEEESCINILTWKFDLSRQVLKYHLVAKQDRNTYTGFGYSFGKDEGPIDATLAFKDSSGKTVVKTMKFPSGSLIPEPSDDQPFKIVKTKLDYKDGSWTLDLDVVPNTEGDKSDEDHTTVPYIVFFPGGGQMKKDYTLGKLLKEPQYVEVFKSEGPGIWGDTEDPIPDEDEPSPPRTKVRFCNFANWAQHYPDPVKFLPSDIDPSLCTHINYCFVWVKDGKLVPTENNDERDHGKRGLMQQINDLKTKGTGLKTILSVGGYDMDIRELTKMLKENRTDFIENAIHYLRRFNFDGINLMFKYPGWGASPPEDKDRFMSLVKEMKDSFVHESSNTNRRRLQLVVSVSVLPEIIARAYNVKELSNTADIIQLLAYDLHGGWEKKAFHHSPIRSSKNSGSLGMTTAVATWANLGADKKKLIIGIPLYGRGGILSDPNKHTPGSSISGPSPKRKYTNEEGLLSYYEICPIVNNKQTQKFWIEDESVPYMVFNDTWVGYDNERSVHLKAKWIIDEGLLGASTWITNFDDFKGTFCHNGRYPLIRTVSDTLLGKKGMVFDD